MAKTDIIQELNELGSFLGEIPRLEVYKVPEGYFQSLSSYLLNYVQSKENPDLESESVELPYSVPAGYFEGLAAQILSKVKENQTAQEEIAGLSPLLSQISREPVYSVPEGYFDHIKIPFGERKEAKIISIHTKRWISYAAAAVFAGFILTAGFLFLNNNMKYSETGRALAKFETDVKKIKDIHQTESLIDLMNAGLNEKSVVVAEKTLKPDEVQNMLKDVTSDELKEFTDQSKDIENVMMTN
jgi:hypothetical protein